MSDPFVDQVKSQQHVLERLIKGLPGLSGYADKELRRNADYEVRQMVAHELERSRSALFEVQDQLLRSGGLAYLDDIDVAVNRLQNLADRVRTASYGYSGLFDPISVGKEQLQALHSFDVAMLKEVSAIEAAITTLRGELTDQAAMPVLINDVADGAAKLSRLFDRRSDAILDPALLLQTDYAPALEPEPQKSVDIPDVPTAGDQYRLIEEDK